MNTQNTPNPKCSSCLCYWKPTENDIKSSGLPYKTCIKCRRKVLCECGAVIQKHHMSSHLQTNYHKVDLLIKNNRQIIDGKIVWLCHMEQE